MSKTPAIGEELAVLKMTVPGYAKIRPPTLNPFLGPSITLGVALIFEELRLRKKEEMTKSKFTDTLNCNAMITQNSHLQAEKPTVSMWPNPFQIDFLRGWNGHLPRAGRDRKFHILWKTRKTWQEAQVLTSLFKTSYRIHVRLLKRALNLCLKACFQHALLEMHEI